MKICRTRVGHIPGSPHATPLYGYTWYTIAIKSAGMALLLIPSKRDTSMDLHLLDSAAVAVFIVMLSTTTPGELHLANSYREN